MTITGHGEKHAYGSRSRPIPHFTDPSCYVSGALAQFGKAVRPDIDATAAGGDAGTADVFTEISRATDKPMWLVEPSLRVSIRVDGCAAASGVPQDVEISALGLGRVKTILRVVRRKIDSNRVRALTTASRVFTQPGSNCDIFASATGR